MQSKDRQNPRRIWIIDIHSSVLIHFRIGWRLSSFSLRSDIISDIRAQRIYFPFGICAKAEEIIVTNEANE
jgi:hypothetical protein